MTDKDIKTIAADLDSLHMKILNHKFAEVVSENEILSLVSAIKVIDRQRAEIERLKSAKSEAVKEFAEKLKEKDGYYNHIFDDCANTEFYSSNYVKGRQEKSREIRETIDNLVKEIGGND